MKWRPTRQLHEGLLQRLKETDVSAGLKSANVHVIDRGHVPTLPSSPNVPRNLALGLMLGLMAGIMLVVGLELLRPDRQELPKTSSGTFACRSWARFQRSKIPGKRRPAVS